MASSPVESPTSGPSTASDASGSRSLVPCYTSRIWMTLRDRLPSLNSSLLAKISHIFRRGTPAHRHRRRGPGLPLLLHSSATMSSSIAARASRASIMLEDIMEYVLCNLHNVQKSLHFWQSQAEGTNARKIYFMIFERGPLAFIDGAYEMISRLGPGGAPFQHLSHAASNTISHKIANLTILRRCLADFLHRFLWKLTSMVER